MVTNPSNPVKRPICPVCGAELVKTDLNLFGNIIHGWICACEAQPEGVARDVWGAREYDAATLEYVVETQSADDAEPSDDSTGVEDESA